MKKYLSIEEADALLEKYYDGTTTGAEETQLREFLQQEALPERFEAERALFGYFAAEKAKPVRSETMGFEPNDTRLTDDQADPRKLPPQTALFRLNPILKWSLAAAVVLFGVFILENRMQAQNRNVAYVNGVRCTDSKAVKALAIASIQDIDLGTDEVAGTVDEMNDANMVESQLQQFPEFN